MISICSKTQMILALGMLMFSTSTNIQAMNYQNQPYTPYGAQNFQLPPAAAAQQSFFESLMSTIGFKTDRQIAIEEQHLRLQEEKLKLEREQFESRRQVAGFWKFLTICCCCLSADTEIV